MWRIDHQLNPKQHVGVPVAARVRAAVQPSAGRPTRPPHRAETTRPTSIKTLVGTLTTVVSNTMVNTVRIGRNAGRHGARQPRHPRAGCFEYASCVPSVPTTMLLGQSLLAAEAGISELQPPGRTTSWISRSNDAYSVEDMFSWFVPGQDGAARREVRGEIHLQLDQQSRITANANGTYKFRPRPGRSTPPTQEPIRNG